jgi:uncharacterized protein (DUF608 family)
MNVYEATKFSTLGKATVLKHHGFLFITGNRNRRCYERTIYNHSVKDVMGLMCLVPELRSSCLHLLYIPISG